MNIKRLLIFNLIIIVIFGFSCNENFDTKLVTGQNVMLRIPFEWVEIEKKNTIFAYKLNAGNIDEYFKMVRFESNKSDMPINDVLCISHNVWKNSKKYKYTGYDINKVKFSNSTHYAGYIKINNNINKEYMLLFCLFKSGENIYRMELLTELINLKTNQQNFMNIINSLLIDNKSTVLTKTINGNTTKINLDTLCNYFDKSIIIK